MNKGIIEVFKRGNITSATLMVNMPGFKDAVELAKRYPRLSVGLHFNLTYGRPVSYKNASSLIDEHGRFSQKQKWKRQHIKRELQAQWNRFCETGLKPTHIDSHQLIQTYPNVFPCIADFAKRKNIPMRLTVPMPSSMTHPMTTDYLIGGTYASLNAVSQLKSNLKSIKHGFTELYCHPGYVDRYVRRYSDWTTVRERELYVFKHVNIRELCRKHGGVILIHYRDLQRIKRSC